MERSFFVQLDTLRQIRVFLRVTFHEKNNSSMETLANIPQLSINLILQLIFSQLKIKFIQF